MKKLIATLILIIILITSCSTLEETKKEAQDTAKSSSESIAEPKHSDVKEPIEDPVIAALIEKASKVNNYQYLYQKTTSISSTGYKVYYLDGKVLKEYLSPKKASNTLSYNKVYLDTLKRNAFAICDSTSVSCDGLRLKFFPISYSSEELPFLPHELPLEITVDAIKGNDELIESRETLLVEYGGTKMNLDKFSGIAMKYSMDGSKESHTFTQLGLNSVEAEEVEVPQDHTFDSRLT